MYRLIILFYTYFLMIGVYAAPVSFQITAFAGNGGLGHNTETQAQNTIFNLPMALAQDHLGNIYIADQYNHRIRKINKSGHISDFAGTGAVGYSGDNAAALDAQLNLPSALVINQAGGLYVADSGNHVIRYIDPDGIIQTIAGNGSAGSLGNEKLAIKAQLRNPHGLALDSEERLYISDTDNHRIRWLDKKGIIHLLVGLKKGFAGDGLALKQVRLNYPRGLSFDNKGQLHIADSGNHRIRFIDTNMNMQTLVGNGRAGFSGDGRQALKAQLHKPYDISHDSDNNLYIADSDNHRIRRVQEGIIHTIAGSGLTEIANGAYGVANGIASQAALNSPYAVLAGLDNTIYIADSRNQRLRVLNSHLAIHGLRTIAGSGKDGVNQGSYAGDNTAADQAHFNVLSAIAIDKQGQVYIADTANHRIRKIDNKGIVHTIAGTGKKGYSGDGAIANQATLNRPAGLALDANDILYISDSGNHVIRRINTQGIITTVAGTGKIGKNNANINAKQARFNYPIGLKFDHHQILYIADSGNHQIRRLINDQIETIAGTGKSGFAGDNAEAKQARLHKPYNIDFDKNGNIYISDKNNNRIRKIDTKGIISTVVGTGKKRYSQNNSSIDKVALSEPAGLIIVGDYMYFSEFGSDRVRVWNMTDTILNTFAGAGIAGFNADNNDASSSQLYAPSGLAVNPQTQELYIADTYNHRIRAVELIQIQTAITLDETPTKTVTDSLVSDAINVENKTNSDNTEVAEVAEVTAPTPNTEKPKQHNDAETVTTTAAIATETIPTTVIKPEKIIKKPIKSVTAFNNPIDTPYFKHQFDCKSLIHPKTIDAKQSYQKHILLDEINQLELLTQRGWKIQQTEKHGYLQLEQKKLRLALWLVQLNHQKNPTGLHVTTEQTTHFYLNNQLILTALPTAQALCELQGHFAAQGFANLTMNNLGNLQIGNQERPIALSFRPDWISTQVKKGIFPGVLFSNALFPAEQLAIAQVFIDENKQLRRQFFYPVPAFDLSQQVQQLQIPPFEPIQFNFEGQAYQGWLDIHVYNSPVRPKLTLETVADFNGDNKADTKIYYPQGFSQLLFTK